MYNYSKDEFYIKRWGMEKCKQADAYFANAEKREWAVYEKAFEKREQLFKLINKKTGLNLNFKMEKDTRNELRFNLESNEIKNPIIALAWDSFVVDNFGSGVYHEDNTKDREDFSKFSPEVICWMNIHFSYHHVDGGSNGAKIGCANFLESKGEWEFELYKDRK